VQPLSEPPQGRARESAEVLVPPPLVLVGVPERIEPVYQRRDARLDGHLRLLVLALPFLPVDGIVIAGRQFSAVLNARPCFLQLILWFDRRKGETTGGR